MSTQGCLEQIDSLDDLVAGLGHLERFAATVALAAAQLNVSGVWAADGALTMAAWLRQHARLSHRDASRLVKQGTFLHSFDDVAAAAVSGVLSAGQVTALRSVVTKPTSDLFGECQAGVIEAITNLPARDSEMVCQAWQAKAEAVVEILGFFNHNNDTNAAVLSNVELIIEHQPGLPGQAAGNDDAGSTDGRTGTGAPFNPHAGPGPGHDHDPVGGCAITANGRMLDSWATDAFLCDCVLHRVLRTSAGKVLDYGRSHHTVPPRLWKAVAIRDRGCRVPGCDRKKAWTDSHHIRWWRRHGETKLDNLILLCQRHHHMVHQYDWHIELDADTGRATFTLPNGTVLISEPPGQPTIRAA